MCSPTQSEVYQRLPPKFGTREDEIAALTSTPIEHLWDQFRYAVHARMTDTTMLADY